MNNLEFDNYKPGYELQEVKIAEKVQKNWPWPRYFSEHALKNRYNRDDFDPDLNLYCFSESQMIGFVTAMKIHSDDETYAYLDLPYAQPGLGNRDEIEQLLYEKMIRILKEKGFGTVETAATTNARNNIELCLERGFREEKGQELGSKMYLNYQISQNTIGSYQEKVRDFDPLSDAELCAEQKQIFVNTVNKVAIYTWERKSFEETLEEMQNMDSKRFFANLVIVDDQLNAHCIGVLNRYNKDICAIGYLYARNEYYLKQVLARLAEICEEEKVGNLLIDLMGQNLGFEKSCLELGFEMVENWAGMRLDLG